jgi:hypothetical protein
MFIQFHNILKESFSSFSIVWYSYEATSIDTYDRSILRKSIYLGKTFLPVNVRKLMG